MIKVIEHVFCLSNCHMCLLKRKLTLNMCLNLRESLRILNLQKQNL